MRRRALLAAPLALLGLPARAEGVPPGGQLAFAVLRKDSEIGTHALRFATDGDTLTVAIDVRMRVGLGPITLFRYRHTGTERYRGGRFESLETETDNDGEPLRVSARREGERVVVRTATGEVKQYGAAALPLTHWNPACMAAPLFNPQDGLPMDLRVVRRGPAEVALADGKLVTATRFSLTGAATLDDFYDSADIWTALRAVAKDGSVLEYRRQE